MERYSSEIELQIKTLYRSLNERERRLFAGLEAKRLGRGGKSYIRGVLGCDFKTINKGAAELCSSIAVEGVFCRQSGGGRKLKIQDSEINEVFLAVISVHTAGSPTDELVKWTYLNQAEIAILMCEQGVVVSRFVVKQLLGKFGFVKRKSQKKTP